jgi:hypothetical protein
MSQEDELVAEFKELVHIVRLVKAPHRPQVRTALVALGGTVLGLVRRTERLTQQLDELKSNPWPTYRGIWEPNVTYPKATTVTYNGAMWFARQETTDKPGTGDHWQLCVKAGRDRRSR